MGYNSPWGSKELDMTERHHFHFLIISAVKNPPATKEIQLQSLGQEDPLEREWQPTPVFLPGKRRSLEGSSPRDHKESDMTEQLNNNSNYPTNL